MLKLDELRAGDRPNEAWGPSIVGPDGALLLAVHDEHIEPEEAIALRDQILSWLQRDRDQNSESIPDPDTAR